MCVTFMGDIIESAPTKEKATKLAKDIQASLEKGNFKMKEWIFTHDRIDLLKTILSDKSSESSTTEKVFLVFMLRHKILKSKFNWPAKLSMSLGVRLTKNISFCKFPAWLCASFQKQSILNIRVLRRM